MTPHSVASTPTTLSLIALSSLFLSCTQYPEPAENPPHIVMILADDMGFADLGHDGSRIDTPHLDQLKEEGIKLTRFYASAPICSPTRAALLTGRFPHTVGVPELCSPEQRGSVPILSLSSEAITLPEILSNHGYTSALAGKWHLGYAPESWPRRHGFDHFWGSLAGTPRYFEPVYTYENEQEIQVKGYFTDLITDAAIRFIRQRPENQPLFLYLAYNAPHYPLEAPEDLIAKYRQVFENEKFAVYAAMVERLDAGIGRVLQTLKEEGISEETLVVFTSDNGPSPEPPAYGLEGARQSAGPLNGHKFSVLEGGIRVPFLARWPGRVKAGSLSDESATIMDLFPTFLDAASIKITKNLELHGQSILPLLLGEYYEPVEDLYWETRLNYAVIAGEWKLVHQRWLDTPFLFNLERDIGESNNLAAEHPEKLSELLELHSLWRQKHFPVQFPAPNSRPKWSFPIE